MELGIVGDSFSVFDPDRGIDAVLSGIHSPKIPPRAEILARPAEGFAVSASVDIDPAAIKAALPHVMITGISYDPFRVLYRLVGTEIVRWARVDFTNRYADELIFQDDGRDWTDYYRAVVAARQPAFGVTDWAVPDGPPYWAEFLICPLSDDGETINRCVAIEDYKIMNVLEVEAREPVTERKREPDTASADEARARMVSSRWRTTRSDHRAGDQRVNQINCLVRPNRAERACYGDVLRSRHSLKDSVRNTDAEGRERYCSGEGGSCAASFRGRLLRCPLALVGCGSDTDSEVTNKMSKKDRKSLPPPTQILVYDFAVSPGEVPPTAPPPANCRARAMIQTTMRNGRSWSTRSPPSSPRSWWRSCRILDLPARRWAVTRRPGLASIRSRASS